MKRTLLTGSALAIAVAALFLLTGCFGQGGSGDPSTSSSSTSSASGPAAVYDTTSIDVSIGDGSGSSTPGALFVGTFADVVRVEVVVSGEDKYGDDQANLATVELTEDPPGTWSGTIPDLPVDPELNFVATGYDASDTPVFSGSTAQVLLGGGGDVVAIAMLPIDDNVAILFPIINSITRPAEIINNEDAAVDVAVTGSSDETLTYEYTSGGGTFTAPSGSITVASNGAGTINTTYTAPDPVGPYSHSIRLTNSQGNSVETDFGTLIVYELTDAEVTTTWAPVITALSGHRSGAGVVWTATVTDDKPLSELSYLWSFAQTDGSPGAVFSPDNTNPGALTGYDETVAGEVSLSVTDADGLTTTVTFTLNAGQFPDVVVVEPSGVVPATCAELLYTGQMWGHSAVGLDLRARTDSTLHFIGCMGDGCAATSFYCNDDPVAQTMNFGTTSNGALRTMIDPGNALGDTNPTSYQSCSDPGDPNSISNGPDKQADAEALCRALGYANATFVRLESNSCPEPSDPSGTGKQWTSDFVFSVGTGQQFSCSGFLP